MVQQAKLEIGCRRALFAPQQGVCAVEQSALVLGSDGATRNLVGLVGHGGIDDEGGLAAGVVLSQLLGGQALRTADLGLVLGLIPQPQLATVLCRDTQREEESDECQIEFLHDEQLMIMLLESKVIHTFRHGKVLCRFLTRIRG